MVSKRVIRKTYKEQVITKVKNLSPELRQTIITLLTRGESLTNIRRTYKVHHCTILSLARKSKIQIGVPRAEYEIVFDEELQIEIKKYPPMWAAGARPIRGV